MRTGMTREEYEAHCRRDPLTLELLTYPKTSAQVKTELVERGYAVSEDMVRSLTRPRKGGPIIPPSDDAPRHARWTADLIDRAADHFEGTQAYTHHGWLCDYFEIPLAEYMEALHVAFRELVEEYGKATVRVVPSASEEHFTTHLETASGDAPARVWFTLREDVRERLEEAAAVAK